MKRISALACIGGALTLASPVAGQTEIATALMAPDGESTVHPAELALRHRKELDLTPEQVSQIRAIQDEMMEAFMPLLETLQAQEHKPDPKVWWGEAELDEQELRRSFHAISEREADLIVRLVDLGQEVYTLLDSRQREALQVHQLNAETRNASAPQERLCIGGNASGGLLLSPKVVVNYTVSFQEDTAEVGVVWVGRAEDKLYGAASLPDRPVIPDAPDFLSGGSMENWYVQYDRETHRAWLDTQRVELGRDNVILLHGVERLHEWPEIVGTHRIPSRVYTGGCRSGTDWTEILRVTLMGSERIRAFVAQD